jgi:DNA-binding transcriptional LysR family regulator
MKDWNDLRLTLAIARAKGLSGAAQILEIDHSTVFRRLGALERRLGVRLFERLPGGNYQPTSAGQRIVDTAERLDDETAALERELVGRDRRLEGRLRVTASETLAYRMLTRELALFRKTQPGIVVEMAIDNRVLSLSRREADIALRATRPQGGQDLWGRKLADVAWTIYGSRDYLAERGSLATLEDLARHDLIGWEEGAGGINAATWLARLVPGTAVIYRTNSLVNQFVAACAGLGLAALPCYLGDPEAALARAFASPIAALARELWIVTHADLRQTARVQAFFQHFTRAIAAQRQLIEGT